MESQAENIRRKTPARQRPHLKKTRIQIEPDFPLPPDPVEFSKSYIETAAADYTNLPHKISENLILEMQAVYNGQIYSMSLKTTVRTMISRIRSDIFTKDVIMMAKPPYANLSDGLLMMRKYSVGTINGEQHQFILWATDESLSLLRHNGPVLIDATFRVVLARSGQIFMSQQHTPSKPPNVRLCYSEGACRLN
ncbi:hypothetical protein HZS_1329 [Henneguya salminicola]|nr:hypothetical protein HZS_1329 [Henneguya salminicola]